MSLTVASCRLMLPCIKLHHSQIIFDIFLGTNIHPESLDTKIEDVAGLVFNLLKILILQDITNVRSNEYDYILKLKALIR